MIQQLWTASIRIRTRRVLRRYMPTNILLDAIRTRRGLRWGLPAVLLAGPYLFVATLCENFVTNGGPGWLHILVVLLTWNALKLLVIGPISLVLLGYLRAREARERRRLHRDAIAARS